MTSQQNQRVLHPSYSQYGQRLRQGEFSRNISPDPVQSTLSRLDLPQAPFDSKSEDREETAEPLCTCGTALEIPEEHEGNIPYTPGSCKSTRKNFGKPASSFSDFYM